MQINESKIAFIRFLLFFRIGTFQRVKDDSNKKIFACVTLCPKCNNRISLLSPRSRQKRGFDPAIGKTYNTDFLVWQEMHMLAVSKNAWLWSSAEAGSGLWKGNRVIAGSKLLIPALEVLFDVE
jgi:hypothetical protein